MLLFCCQSGVAGATGLRHIHLVKIIDKLVVIVGKPLHRFSYPASDASNRRIISQPLVPYRAAKNGYVPKSPLRCLQCSGSAIVACLRAAKKRRRTEVSVPCSGSGGGSVIGWA